MVVVGGRRLTVKVREKKKRKKKMSAGDRESKAEEKKNEAELKVFHFKCCGRTARNGCCNQNKPGAPTGPGSEKDDRK